MVTLGFHSVKMNLILVTVRAVGIRFPFSSVQSVQPAQTKAIFFLPSSGIKSVLKL